MNLQKNLWNGRLLLAVGVLILTSAPALAKDGGGTYIAATYGVATSSSAVTMFDGLSGKVMGAQLGTHLGSSFALELTFRNTTFESSSTTLDFSSLNLGTATVASELKATVIGLGGRLFFLKYLNVTFGIGYSTVDPQISTTATDPTVAAAVAASTGDTKGSGLGMLYGVGAQLPLGKLEITADYIINNFAGDASSKEISGGLRLRF